MELKKSPKADLEKKKTLFFQIGLILTLAATLFAFEWKSYEKREVVLQNREVVDIPEEIIPITKPEELPPPPEAPKTTTELRIVDNEVEVEDDIIIDVEASEDTQVEAYEPPPMEVDDEVEEETIFIVVEEIADFPGGNNARMKFLRDNINYPQLARESGIQGSVFLTFVVERDGSITDIKVLRGIGGGCDEESIRVTKKMPKWIPGKQRGKPVRSQFNMPIKFTLQ